MAHDSTGQAGAHLEHNRDRILEAIAATVEVWGATPISAAQASQEIFDFIQSEIANGLDIQSLGLGRRPD